MKLLAIALALFALVSLPSADVLAPGAQRAQPVHLTYGMIGANQGPTLIGTVHAVTALPVYLHVTITESWNHFERNLAPTPTSGYSEAMRMDYAFGQGGFEGSDQVAIMSTFLGGALATFTGSDQPNGPDWRYSTFSYTSTELTLGPFYANGAGNVEIPILVQPHATMDLWNGQAPFYSPYASWPYGTGNPFYWTIDSLNVSVNGILSLQP